jgi:DNA-binding MarR family transcriptional regulator
MLLNEVSRLCMAVANRAHGEDQARMKHSERIILVRLSKKDGQTQAELVRASKMTPPSISATLKIMESEGLIVRKKDEDDQRITRVYLTDIGRLTEEKNFEVIKRVDGLAMEGISGEEQAALVSVLLKMRDNLTRELNIKNEIE